MNKYYNTDILKQYGGEMFDLIERSKANIQETLPNVESGFLHKKLKEEIPENPSSISNIFEDLQNIIQKGVPNLNNPLNLANFTGDISNLTYISEMFACAFHTPGFSWEASPSQTELENIVMDWLCDLFNLPSKFRIKETGGGTISSSTTHSYLHSINVAKQKKTEELNVEFYDEKVINFVAYYSETNKIRIEKALKLKEIIHQRIIPLKYDSEKKNFSMDIEILKSQILEDKTKGLIPFWVDCSFGSEGLCHIDDIEKIGKICINNKISLNVNACWGGLFLCLPEYSLYSKYLEYADFVLINGRYLDLGGYTSFMHFSDKQLFCRAVGGVMSYPMVKLKQNDAINVIHLKDFNMGLGKRFNSFKVYFLIRSIGVEGIRKFLIKKIELINYFIEKIKNEEFIKIVENNYFGVICFELFKFPKQEFLNKNIIGNLNIGNRNLYRICINSNKTSEQDLDNLIALLKEN